MNEEKKTSELQMREKTRDSGNRAAKSQHRRPELVYKEMADEAPEPLLYEEKVYRAYYIGKWPDSERILQNGEIWYCYDWAYIPDKGKYVYHGPNRPDTKGKAVTLPRIWRHWGEVATPEELEDLREFIRKSKVLELPDEVRGEGGCIGGTNVFHTVEVDGKRRTILWTQCGDQPPEPLKSLEGLVDDIVFRAGNRWVEKYRRLIVD